MNEIGFSSAVIGVSIPVGSLLGMAISGFVFGESQNVQESLYNLILYANIVLTFFFILFLVTFREKPTQPPSEIALQEPPKRDLIDSFRELRENKNFVIIAIYYMLIFGLYASFANL